MIAYQWTAKTVQQISADLHTTDAGLSEAEAARRLREIGSNDIHASTVSLFSIFTKQYANFLMLLLAFGAGLSLFLGQTVDGLVILSILVLNGALGTFQEYRAQQTSLALRKHIPQRVSVRRGGVVKIIQRSQLVPGDVVVIQSGQVISADMRLIKNFGLIVDESSLTGESTGIVKQAEPLRVAPSAIHECSNILFSGTVSIAGGGEAIVFATGKQSEFGKIITLTHTSKKRSSFLEQVHVPLLFCPAHARQPPEFRFGISQETIERKPCLLRAVRARPHLLDFPQSGGNRTTAGG
jgi:magnesium-transporting ATPase (P-type)